MASSQTIDEEVLRSVLEQVSQLDEGMKEKLRGMLPNVDHSLQASLLADMTSTNFGILQQAEAAHKDVEQTLQRLAEHLQSSMAQASVTVQDRAEQFASVVRAKLAAEEASWQLQMQMTAIEELEERMAQSLSRAQTVKAGFRTLDEQFRAGTQRLVAMLEEAELDELPVLSYFHQAGQTVPQEDGWCSSTFHLELPRCEGPCCADADSDDEDVIQVRHQVRTSLAEVGLQVWQAALILVDFMAHRHQQFIDAVVVELGAGAGLTSVVIRRFVKLLFATDHVPTVLENLQHNVQCNSAFSGAHSASCRIRHLDFAAVTPSPLTHDFGEELPPGTGKWEWTSNDWEVLQDQVPLVMATDVTYNDATALLTFLRLYFRRHPHGTAFLAVEVRGGDLLKSQLVEQPSGEGAADFASHLDALRQADGSLTCNRPPCWTKGEDLMLVGERCLLDFPSVVQGVGPRSDVVHLWMVTAQPKG